MSGFSERGLARLERVLARHVDAGTVPGAVALVGRGEATEAVLLGSTEVGGPPVARDTIFRISSMT